MLKPVALLSDPIERSCVPPIDRYFLFLCFVRFTITRVHSPHREGKFWSNTLRDQPRIWVCL